MASTPELADTEHGGTRQRASIIIPVDLHRRAKAFAATRGRSLGEWAADALVRALDEADQQQSSGKGTRT